MDERIDGITLDPVRFADPWLRINLSRKRYNVLLMALRFHVNESSNEVAKVQTREVLRYLESRA